MRHVNLDLDLSFDTPDERWRSEQVLLYLMTILTLRNYWFLLDNPDFPHLYDSNMCYLLPEQLERRPKSSQIDALKKFCVQQMGMTADEAQHHVDLAKGVEIFRDIPRMMEHGGGDCDNWAAARAAEICVAAFRIGGKSNARPYLVWREEGDRMIYHAKVLHSDGSDEDPSIIMGMGGQDRRADRLEECRKNWERYDNMFQIGKRLVADGADAVEVKAAIDSFGYLPKDGVFRVCQPKNGKVTQVRGLDLLGATKPKLLGHGGGGHGGGGHHGGGHGGGGSRGGWGGGWGVYPQWDYPQEYELEIELEMPDHEFVSPSRRGRW
jgi:hypothetical protein